MVAPRSATRLSELARLVAPTSRRLLLAVSLENASETLALRYELNV
jgi:hypothetical protein